MPYLPLKSRHFEIISVIAQSASGYCYISGREVSRGQHRAKLSKRISSLNLVDERVFTGSLIRGINLKSLIGEIPRKRLI